MTPRNMRSFMACWFILAESNTNSESLFRLLLLAALSYYLCSLYKHLFHFQARVEQSVPFHHFPSFSSYYDARVKTSRTGSAAIREPMCPAGCPENTRPACTPGTSRTNPSPSCPRCPGPCPNWDSKPPPLSPGLSAVQGPPPSPSPISRSGKSRIHDKRATSFPCAHTQVCARDNRSVTCLASIATTGP